MLVDVTAVRPPRLLMDGAGRLVPQRLRPFGSLHRSAAASPTYCAAAS